MTDISTLLDPLIVHAPAPPEIDVLVDRVGRRRRRRWARRGAALIAVCAVMFTAVTVAATRDDPAPQQLNLVDESTTATTTPQPLGRLFSGDVVPDPGDLSITLDEGTVRVTLAIGEDQSQLVCIATLFRTNGGNGTTCAPTHNLLVITTAGASSACGPETIHAGLTVPDASTVTVETGGQTFVARTATAPGFPATLFAVLLPTTPTVPVVTVTSPTLGTLTDRPPGGPVSVGPTGGQCDSGN